MVNRIEKELVHSQQYMLETIPKSGNPALVRLCANNVAIVEAMIHNDSDYIRSSNPNAAPIIGPQGKVSYGGSSAYWFMQLKPSLVEHEHIAESCYRRLMSEAINSVDRENSTHLNADGVGRNEILNRILSLSKDDLIYQLKYPDETELALVNMIASRTHADSRARVNLSFASKFCHYACFYLFEGEPEQDNYSIYDNILRQSLPRYLEYYQLNGYNLNLYPEYRKAIDSIIEASDSGISRNGFDHLLWYYFKGRL